eukprot:TRINITY_DN5207_c0_g1_i4.p1 TRINITY_DN5207_c0_g1~~TRINITY_DN5207_c0_g1_i4.p1  ORF type:complete len:215 (+),score=15.36 TRINITY_DN5207_c0_g1_i4:49-693(+)
MLFFFSSRRRHTRQESVSWARRCVQETGDVISKERHDDRFTQHQICFGWPSRPHDHPRRQIIKSSGLRKSASLSPRRTIPGSRRMQMQTYILLYLNCKPYNLLIVCYAGCGICNGPLPANCLNWLCQKSCPFWGFFLDPISCTCKRNDRQEASFNSCHVQLVHVAALTARDLYRLIVSMLSCPKVPLLAPKPVLLVISWKRELLFALSLPALVR